MKLQSMRLPEPMSRLLHILVLFSIAYISPASATCGAKTTGACRVKHKTEGSVLLQRARKTNATPKRLDRDSRLGREGGKVEVGDCVEFREEEGIACVVKIVSASTIAVDYKDGITSYEELMVETLKNPHKCDFCKGDEHADEDEEETAEQQKVEEHEETHVESTAGREELSYEVGDCVEFREEEGIACVVKVLSVSTIAVDHKDGITSYEELMVETLKNPHKCDFCKDDEYADEDEEETAEQQKVEEHEETHVESTAGREGLSYEVGECVEFKEEEGIACVVKVLSASTIAVDHKDGITSYEEVLIETLKNPHECNFCKGGGAKEVRTYEKENVEENEKVDEEEAEHGEEKEGEEEEEEKERQKLYNAAAFKVASAGVGYSPVEWDYNFGDQNGISGWSYYLRAFNLIRDQPVAELGWGQWSKPSAAKDQKVCGINPLGFMCDEEPPTEEELPLLRNCGAAGDPDKMANCTFWVCGEEEQGGVRGSIEGGMGYWMYTLETPHVKWMLPGATNANYEVFGGTFLADQPQACTKLGGAVRISNRIVIPNDMVNFEGGDNTDGFLGYMLARTGIGKRSDTDDANYWTIIIDAANFAGPVMYMSSWFWDMRINWHPESISWSDPRSLIGYIAQGWEGRVGGFMKNDSDGTQYYKFNQMGLPKDKKKSPQDPLTTTLKTGHSHYPHDGVKSAIEPLLDGSGDMVQLLDDMQKKRAKPECHHQYSQKSDPSGMGLTLEYDDGSERAVNGLGVGSKAALSDEEVNAAQQASDKAHCHVQLTLDENVMDCTSVEGMCLPPQHLQVNDQSAGPVKKEELPEDVANFFEKVSFDELKTSRNQGDFLGPPAETESACFDMPGPAEDGKLYCTRTKEKTWIGWKWYRFVDQPELNQVFASLPGAAARVAAKCYMQKRIENLHKAHKPVNGKFPRWFKPPQGDEHMPQDLVEIDNGLIVEPPEGLEVGYVPIPLWQRKKEMPPDCSVILGDFQTEPAPFPEGYYEKNAWKPNGHGNVGDYEVEHCPANADAPDGFMYPGTVYPYSPSSTQKDRPSYTIPGRQHVEQSIKERLVEEVAGMSCST